MAERYNSYDEMLDFYIGDDCVSSFKTWDYIIREVVIKSKCSVDEQMDDFIKGFSASKKKKKIGKSIFSSDA